MQRGLGGFPHERLHQDNVVCTKLGVKTEAEILPKYPQTYFSLGRLDMARGPRHPSTAFSNFLVVNGKAYVILK